MVCTAKELSKWENFPKGLRVLLLDEDNNSAAETKSKLESMDYIVTILSNVSEACSAISENPGSFHVAIVEVSTSDKNGSFKFLEAVKDLPTIMTSSIHCLSTMMKCIALGAVEFLHKPLSEDKLKNIWQHVVHKAFNVGGTSVSESLKSVKESVFSMLHLESESGKMKRENSEERENLVVVEEKDPAPSTPQLKQGARLLDDGDCQDYANCSTENANCLTEKENVDHEIGESKSIETTNCVTEGNKNVRQTEGGDCIVKEEVEGEADDLKNDNIVSLYHQPNQSKDNVRDSCRSDHLNKASGIKNASGNKANRKKVDWTPELHKKFVQAVEQLGVDQAIPSRILELMKVEGLTRHNVASHLQKYRMHRRNILPREDHEGRWIQPRDNQMQQQRYKYPHRPIMAYPPYHQPHPPNLVAPAYPIWGLPGVHPPGGHLWGRPGYSPGYPPWQPRENWHWKPPYSGVHANAWGCPVMPPTNIPSHTSQNSSWFQYSGSTDNGFKMPHPNSLNLHPEEEVIDKLVKEAINKPWLPLPLGLKPPSTDSVLAELSRQGISTVPSSSSNDGSRLC